MRAIALEKERKWGKCRKDNTVEDAVRWAVQDESESACETEIDEFGGRRVCCGRGFLGHFFYI